LLKRSESRDIYQIADIQIDLENKTVVRAWEEVHLTMKEFLILTYLLESNGHAVSRSDLIEFVRWGDALYEHDSKLDVYIANLRKKLGKELIITIKGFGYKLGG
jgi:two-component system OmpR family response regulator